MRRQRELDLKGKVAIVTGASRGIGRRAALTLARRGVNIVVAARTVDEMEALPGTIGETAKQVEATGARALAVETDLSNEEDLHRLVDAATSHFGGVDILINNAASTVGRSWTVFLKDMPREDWLYQFAVNLHAPFTLIQRVAPVMESRGGGRIINLTTGQVGPPRAVDDRRQPSASPARPTFLAYFASRSALDRFSNVVAPELEEKNISIINTHPGWVRTENAQKRLDERGEVAPDMIPMDVPARMLAYFAACEDPGEYTGQIFRADHALEEMGIEVDPALT